ncbi:iron reductase [Coniophora puteana RWD-64-598 SS2]|uniref:ferric-chelate reductase (NADPH) n=1 Tax=Coniophora puteana (strain RWD-64-598) TaxID=741705 RepID=A0A5M3N2N7_CONPW|nr:iron reductase [Coniophora puteana RWD-64-598 SS2]EIW85649.1 iron reductase [Coniophora puteana RWD-64-598 SS2]
MAQETSATDRQLSSSRTNLYPLELWWSVAIFMFVVGTFNWGSYIHARLSRSRHHRTIDIERGPSPPTRAHPLWRYPLAVLNVFRVVAYRWTLSFGGSYSLSVAEMFVTAAYVALVFTYAFINCTSPIFLLRNIPQLNYMHRVIGRTVFALLWVHGGSELYRCLQTFPEDLASDWLRLGLVAQVALTILVIVSIRPIRARFYEFFSLTHTVMVFIFVLGGYYHAKPLHGAYWIWSAFVFWGLDRFIRLVRLIAFNYSYFGVKSGFGSTNATTELISDNLVRLRIKRPPHFHWTPGQTAYLVMPSVSTLPFESHPFTIASVDSECFVSAPGEKSEDEEGAMWGDVVFLINVHKGFTKRLGKVAAAKGEVRVFVDGPYGSTPEIGCYDTCVLVAGGTGVAHTLPVLLGIVEAARNNTSRCTRVSFIWAVRDPNHIEPVEHALARAIKLAPPGLAVAIRIHVTGASAPSTAVTSRTISITDDASAATAAALTSNPVQEKSALAALDAVRVEYGRPDLQTLLSEETSATDERIFVDVCGSDALTRATKKALCFPVSGPSSVVSGGPSVTLRVDSFGYA